MKPIAAFAVIALGLWAATIPARAQVVHSFQGSPDDGSFPLGGLITNGGKSLYGTTYTGGDGCVWR